MPALKNTKHEKFIQNIIKGKSQRQAYKIAFGVNYDNAAIDCKASKLFNTDKVQTRYKELLTKLEKKNNYECRRTYGMANKCCNWRNQRKIQ